jgi:hypothetical protein
VTDNGAEPPHGEALKEPERRRATRRGTFADHGIHTIRIRPGDGAEVIDVSEYGVLVETNRRLLPGTAVELQMETEKDRTILRGCVLRCAVSQVRAARVAYRGAIVFDRSLPWFMEEPGYAVPTGEQRSGRPERAPSTQTLL